MRGEVLEGDRDGPVWPESSEQRWAAAKLKTPGRNGKWPLRCEAGLTERPWAGLAGRV